MPLGLTNLAMAKTFGTVADYYRAFKAIERAGIHPSHRDLLRAHFAAPQHTVSWRELAPSVGYANAEAVKLQYGSFARKVAAQLGITKRPEGFWSYVLADWGSGLDGRGHTTFTMRPQVVAALKRLGWLEGAPPPSLLETDDGMLEGRPELRIVAHRHREAALRRQKLAQAIRESPDGKLRCGVPGCGFCFEDVYGSEVKSFIQVHHLEQLGKRRRASRTRLQDLVIICANCHAMLHFLDPSPPLSRLVLSPLT